MFYKEIALYHEGHHHDHDHVHTDCGCGCHTHEEEMSKDEKNSISHRGKAVRKLEAWLDAQKH